MGSRHLPEQTDVSESAFTHRRHGNVHPLAARSDGKEDGRHCICQVLLFCLVAPPINPSAERSSHDVQNNGRAWSRQSLGIGLAALLSGVERYIALDVIQYASDAQNLRIFEGLIALFKDRAPIPDEAGSACTAAAAIIRVPCGSSHVCALGRDASPGSVGAGSTRHY